jgi:hypothetical protein
MIGWCILVVLPGSWLTFGFRSKALPFGIKLLGGVMLSPLVVIAQYYALRLVGIPFEPTAQILPLVNLPGLYLIWRNRESAAILGKYHILAVVFTVIIAVISLAPHLISPERRAFSGHAWTHGDIIYQLSNGVLRPEEPELAGISLAYPWGGHVFQGVLSFLIDSPPVSSYIWTNLLWLVCLGLCVSYIVAELGGSPFARFTAPLWLYFSLNWTGYILQEILPSGIGRKLWIGGDYRYTPWILKSFFFEQVIFGLGMLAVLIYVTLKAQAADNDRALTMMIFMLLVGIGIVYPILIIPAGIVVCSGVIVNHFYSRKGAGTFSGRQNFNHILVLAAAGLVTAIHLKLVAIDRVTNAIQWPAPTRYFVTYTFLKGLGSAIAVSVMVGAYAYIFLGRRETIDKPKILLLGISSALILLVNILFELPFYGNEYKFILAIALCLSPFPAIAFAWLGRYSISIQVIAGAFLGIVLAAPFAHKLWSDYPWHPVYEESSATPTSEPSIALDSFDLQLAEGEEMFELCERIRLETPRNSVLVMESTGVHLPSLTQRALFVSPDYAGKRPGVNLSSSELLTDVRGYDEKIFVDRKRILSTLFNSQNQLDIEESIRSIRELKRPVAIVLDVYGPAALRQRLMATDGASILFSTRDREVWLIT